jgi:hypothetical protein
MFFDCQHFLPIVLKVNVYLMTKQENQNAIQILWIRNTNYVPESAVLI